MSDSEPSVELDDPNAAYEALDAFTREWVGSDKHQRSLLMLTRAEKAEFHRASVVLEGDLKLARELATIETEHDITLHALWTLAPRVEGVSASAIVVFFSPELDSIINTVVLDYDVLRKVALS